MAQRNYKGVATGGTTQGNGTIIKQLLLGICLSIFTALCIPPIIKEVALAAGMVTLICGIVFHKGLRERLSLLGVAVLLLTAMTGLSVFYAPDRQISFPEFCNLFVGFCLFVLFIIFAGGTSEKRRSGMTVVAISVATTSLVSIDLLSTRILSGAFATATNLFTTNYNNVSGIETGIRMTSLYTDSNVFAGVAGIGVLLALGLVASAEKRGERILTTICLFLNALAFVLTFSMGATAAIAVAFVMMLVLEQRERRISLLVIMVETLMITLLSSVPIFATAFVTWSGFQPIPLVCAVVGSLLLCVLHLRMGQPMADKLNQHSKAATISIGAVFAAVIVFGVVAYNWTGATTLSAGESLRRSAYPAGGVYQLEIDSDSPLTVTIESQNEEDTLNHTSSIIYRGDASDATFEVPEDSMVVYFNFVATEDTTFQTAILTGENGAISLKLGYKLLPGFMANRLQGLWANENAIQRTAFFQDGLTIFKTSPIFGRGVGAFESLFLSIQEYDYGTRYVHNHYIQLLLETGIIGLTVFLGVMGLAVLALIRLRKSGVDSTISVALLACLLFMAFHATVEVVFSMGTYLAVALPTFGLIVAYAGEWIPLPTAPARGKLSQIVVAVATGFVVIWVVLIGLNRAMPILVTNSNQGGFLKSIQLAATLDRFDGDDYRYSCIALATQFDDEALVAQAVEYAQELMDETEPNELKTLTEFFLSQGDMDSAMVTLEKFMDYNPDDIDGWEYGFAMLWSGEESIEERQFAAAVAEFYDFFQSYNGANGNKLALSAVTEAQINSIIG